MRNIFLTVEERDSSRYLTNLLCLQQVRNIFSTTESSSFASKLLHIRVNSEAWKSLVGRFFITISLLFGVFSIRLGMIIARQGGAGAVSTLDSVTIVNIPEPGRKGSPILT